MTRPWSILDTCRLKVGGGRIVTLGAQDAGKPYAWGWQGIAVAFSS